MSISAISRGTGDRVPTIGDIVWRLITGSTVRAALPEAARAPVICVRTRCDRRCLPHLGSLAASAAEALKQREVDRVGPSIFCFLLLSGTHRKNNVAKEKKNVYSSILRLGYK